MPYDFDDIPADPPQTSEELEQLLGLSTQPEPALRHRIERTAEQDAATLQWLRESNQQLDAICERARHRPMLAGTYTGDAEVQE